MNRPARRAKNDEAVLRVSASSNVKALAGAIVSHIEKDDRVAMIAVGAGAVNQMVKSICIARGFTAQQGIDLYVLPGFKDEIVGGERKSAIRFFIRIR